MKKKFLNKSILRIVISFVLLFEILIINILTYSTKQDLKLLVSIFSIDTLLVIYCFLKFVGSLKGLILSVEFIYICIFYLYAIFAPVQYLLDDGMQRQYYFAITDITICKSTLLYLNIFIVLSILLLLGGYPKNKNNVEWFKNKLYLKKRNKTNIIFDVLAIVCLMIWVFQFLKNGFSIFNASFLVRRKLLSFGVQQYIWLYMMVYSFVFISECGFEKSYFNKKEKLFKIIIIVLFWGLSLLIDRRHIIPVFVGILMFLVSQKNKIKFKNVIIVIGIVALLLLYSVTRMGMKVTTISFKNLTYTSLSEFILTNYVTCYYIANPIDKLYLGSTYIWHTISRLFPHFILPNKPEDLAVTFYRNVLNSKVGYAFNPVAEGLINFGNVSIIITPLIFLFVINLAVKNRDKNPLFYIIVSAYSLDFCRGQFANCMFDLLFMYILLKMMNRFSENNL